MELLVFHNRKVSVKARADVTGLKGVKSTVLLKILAENNLSLLFIYCFQWINLNTLIRMSYNIIQNIILLRTVIEVLLSKQCCFLPP